MVFMCSEKLGLLFVILIKQDSIIISRKFLKPFQSSIYMNIIAINEPHTHFGIIFSNGGIGDLLNQWCSKASFTFNLLREN